MDLPDINVRIYAHRDDAPDHDQYAAWLIGLANGPLPFALSWMTLGVTNLRGELLSQSENYSRSFRATL